MTRERVEDCVVRPLRFTDDILAMRDFPSLLGLAPRVESPRGGWLDMIAGAGMIALHDATSSDSGCVFGEIRPSFEGADLDAPAVGWPTPVGSRRPSGTRRTAGSSRD